MWCRVAPPVLVLTALLFGCGQGSNLPAGSGEVDDAIKELNEVKTSIKASTPVPAGASLSVAQVGSHRVKTISDVPASTVWRGESAEITVGEQKLTADFAGGKILADGAEKAKLPAGTKELEVRSIGGKLSVSADGTALLGAGGAK